MEIENRFYDACKRWKYEDYRLQALSKLEEELGQCFLGLYSSHEKNEYPEENFMLLCKSLIEDFREAQDYINKNFELE